MSKTTLRLHWTEWNGLDHPVLVVADCAGFRHAAVATPLNDPPWQGAPFPPGIRVVFHVDMHAGYTCEHLELREFLDTVMRGDTIPTAVREAVRKLLSDRPNPTAVTERSGRYPSGAEWAQTYLTWD